MSTLDYDLYVATSDFLKREVQPQGFHNEDTLYMNFDAFWDRLTPDEMEDALKRVRENGHKPGTYWTPFAFWGSPAGFGAPWRAPMGSTPMAIFCFATKMARFCRMSTADLRLILRIPEPGANRLVHG